MVWGNWTPCATHITRMSLQSLAGTEKNTVSIFSNSSTPKQILENLLAIDDTMYGDTNARSTLMLTFKTFVTSVWNLLNSTRGVFSIFSELDKEIIETLKAPRPMFNVSNPERDLVLQNTAGQTFGQTTIFSMFAKGQEKKFSSWKYTSPSCVSGTQWHTKLSFYFASFFRASPLINLSISMPGNRFEEKLISVQLQHCVVQLPVLVWRSLPLHLSGFRVAAAQPEAKQKRGPLIKHKDLMTGTPDLATDKLFVCVCVRVCVCLLVVCCVLCVCLCAFESRTLSLSPPSLSLPLSLSLSLSHSLFPSLSLSHSIVQVPFILSVAVRNETTNLMQMCVLGNFTQWNDTFVLFLKFTWVNHWKIFISGKFELRIAQLHAKIKHMLDCIHTMNMFYLIIVIVLCSIYRTKSALSYQEAFIWWSWEWR